MVTVILQSRGTGYAATFPYDKELVRNIKLCAGFAWNQSIKAWVSEGPEVLLDLERYRIPYTPMDKGTEQSILDFYVSLERIIKLKRENSNLLSGGSAELYGFQRIGSDSLGVQLRGLLADEMGLGKTKQALDACEFTGAKTILALVPLTLVYNWRNEVEKWHPDWDTLIVPSDKSARIKFYRELPKTLAAVTVPTVVITNHEKARLADFPKRQPWDALIIDEAHKIKNTQAAIHKAIDGIAKRSKSVFALTGTPLEMRAEETYGILKVIRPSVFGAWWRFREQHCDVDWSGRVMGLDPNSQELFKERLGPWMTRRTKAQVAKQLPPKVYSPILIELSAAERMMYKEIAKGFDTWVESQGKMTGSATVLTQLIRFQQFTSSPELLGADHLSPGSKYLALYELLDGWEGQVLIFSRFKTMANLLHGWLKAHPDAIITGDVNQPEERMRRIDEFNAGRLGKVFVGTDAMATGLNITSADLIVHYDKLWNPAKEWQREDRLHRIGQTKVVNVVHLLCVGTIDIGMSVVTEKRAALFRDVVDGAEETVLASYSTGDYKKIIAGEYK